MAEAHNPADNAASKPVIQLSPAWQERVARAVAEKQNQLEPVRILPRRGGFYEHGINVVDNAASAATMLDFARQRPLSFIGLDTEFRYSRPGVLMAHRDGRDFFWQDPRSVVPLIVSLAMVETNAADDGHIYRFVVDVRESGVRDALADLLRQPLPFIAHYAQAELFCLWQLGLPAPAMLWDTWTAEKAFHLGAHHPRYKTPATADETDEVRARLETEEETEFSLSLVGTCQRYSIPYAFTADKVPMPSQRRFGHQERRTPAVRRLPSVCYEIPRDVPGNDIFLWSSDLLFALHYSFNASFCNRSLHGYV
jgi:hypothetical protein